MKNVLILITNLRGGGAERVVVDLVNNYKSNKYSLTLMTLYDEGINKSLLNKEVDYRYYKKHQIRGIWRLYRLMPASLLHKMIIKDDFDIEIAYLEGIPTKVISGCNNSMVKKATWLHCELTDHETYFLNMYGSKRAFRKTYSLFERIVCVSRDVKASFEKKLLVNNSLNVVHNTIDEHRIIQLSEENNNFDVNPDTINFVSAGRIVEQKGYKRLLRVFNRLKQYNVHLYIMGEGPDFVFLKEYVSKNRMNNVTLLGFMENPYRIIKKMDCYICSSFQEGYSTSVAEAIILGVPVISTKCSGSGELCEGGAGVVCDNSEEGIYKAILDYINNPILRNQLSDAVKNKENRITIERTLKEFDDLLKELSH